MITRRGFFGAVAALVVGGGAARLRLTPRAKEPLCYFLRREGPWVFYGGSVGAGKSAAWRSLEVVSTFEFDLAREVRR